MITNKSRFTLNSSIKTKNIGEYKSQANLKDVVQFELRI